MFIFTENLFRMKHFLFIISLAFISCAEDRIPADLLVKNANIYTVNVNFDKAEAFVVKDGRILEIGTTLELEQKYITAETLDVDGKTLVPGLIDGHAHLYNLGLSLQNVDLVGTKSYQEVLEKVVAFQKENNTNYIVGRGWDQNDWEIKGFPTKTELDSLFPDTPVALERVDGHAYIANSKALELAGITVKTKVSGGEVVLVNGEPSGILIDMPMELINKTIPALSREQKIKALKDAEKVCLELGLTTINDAGLDRDIIELIDSLQQSGEMSIKVYAMISNTKSNRDYYFKKGIIKTDRLTVRSFKVYADGALGSRGAAMIEAYSDKENHFGALITPKDSINYYAQRIAVSGFQMNTHAIGDAANDIVMEAYRKALMGTKDLRWKVEHAQVLASSGLRYFGRHIIPSVQPTHATSDMYWAEDRIGEERIERAYVYKTLLNKAELIVLGTDFPVEKVNPMYTFYAAVARKDLNNFPEGGYRPKEALSRLETLKGMTIWPAYSNFEENDKGSIVTRKFADFTVLDQDIMTIPEDSIPKVKVLATYINGKKVFGSQ
jgi:predicted amidohydrolase YtcJ